MSWTFSIGLTNPFWACSTCIDAEQLCLPDSARERKLFVFARRIGLDLPHYQPCSRLQGETDGSSWYQRKKSRNASSSCRPGSVVRSRCLRTTAGSMRCWRRTWALVSPNTLLRSTAGESPGGTGPCSNSGTCGEARKTLVYFK